MANPTRLCLDTSVLVRALTGPPQSVALSIVEAVREGRMILVVTPEIEQEYLRVVFRRSVQRNIARNGRTSQEFLNGVADVRRNAELIRTVGEAPHCRDEADRKYLHCARDGAVPFLVTYDHDLLQAPPLTGTSIVVPTDFVAATGLR